MATPRPELVSAARTMVTDCLRQLDPELADSVLELAPPDHPLNVWGSGYGEQVLVMSGKLRDGHRFDAICVFRVHGKGTVTIHFKSGQHENKHCVIPTCRIEGSWQPTVAELRWDDEAT